MWGVLFASLSLLTEARSTGGVFQVCGAHGDLTPWIQSSIGLPVGLYFSHWMLSFKQSSLHPFGQLSQSRLGYTDLASRCFTDRLCSQASFLVC
jgi:hypothetical protein